MKRQDVCLFNINVSIRYNLEKQKPVLKLVIFIFRDHQSIVNNCTFNKYERLYATCSWDKTILLYDITTGCFR